MRVFAAASESLAEGGRLVLDIGPRTVGIFRLDGRLHAYDNVCPHQGGPVCQGRILPCVVENLAESKASAGMAFDESRMHIVCPWHGFEFEIATGRHAGSAAIQLRRVKVEEAEGRIYVAL